MTTKQASEQKRKGDGGRKKEDEKLKVLPNGQETFWLSPYPHREKSLILKPNISNCSFKHPHTGGLPWWSSG